eukprot:TRINITY_DN32229_c0_g1_i1.p1 TRINITY_DN32229_c0_g1~~TRINITY_DN32229_c0_g1_i1.p1  ORF type:complete len:549 (+),score=204.77 TRINITY_DN32229_c0_g1_i1:139-1785(+)
MGGMFGRSSGKVEDTAGQGVFREIHYSDEQFETKGRVKLMCVCKKSGLLLVAVERGVLVWSLSDGCYYREYPLEGDVCALAEHQEGKHFLVSMVVMNRPVVQKVLFTRRIAAAAFANLDSAGRDKGIDAGKVFVEEHDIRYDSAAKHGKNLDNPVEDTDGDIDCPSPRRVKYSRRYQVTDGVTRILPLASNYSQAYMCAAPDIILWDFDRDRPAWVYRAFYPGEATPVIKTDDDRLIIGQKGVVAILHCASKKRETHAVPGMARAHIHAVASKGHVVFAASERNIVKYNTLSKQAVRRWSCEATVGRMIYESGVLFVVGVNRSYVDVIDGKCGRHLGAYRASVTRLIPETLCLWENMLIVVDDPHEGEGFKTLVKAFALPAWFSHLPWLIEYAKLWSAEYKRPTPQLRDEVFAAGPLSVLLTNDNGGDEAEQRMGPAPYKHLADEQRMVESVPIQKYGYTVRLRRKQQEAIRSDSPPPPPALNSPQQVTLDASLTDVSPMTQRSDVPLRLSPRTPTSTQDAGLPSLGTSTHSATTTERDPPNDKAPGE